MYATAFFPVSHVFSTSPAVVAKSASQECRRSSICARVKETLESIPGVRCDYVELVDASTLQRSVSPHRLALLAVAAWFGDVRLIDNIELSRS